MELYEILNQTLELIEATTENGKMFPKFWMSEKVTLYISNENISNYNQLLENCYSTNEKIFTRFTRTKVYKHIESILIENKTNKKSFTSENTNNFFKQFLDLKPYNKYIVAPISGLRLDNTDKINISGFEIGKTSLLKFILSNDTDGYYISIRINNIYDDLIAKEEAKDKFLDFIRLIVFISGKNDKKVVMKVGLPSYPSVSHEKMYVETSSYQVLDKMSEGFPSSSINNTYVEKVPIDIDFFSNNDDFKEIFKIYEKKHLNKKIQKMESRLLNAAIAIGESALSKNIKNSIIYTSMALEILFSYDEGSLFQKSIGEKLSDTFAFMVGKDKESRLNASKSIKTFYQQSPLMV